MIEIGRLDGKRMIVTGAASGLGRASATRFVAEGARVVLADLDEMGAAAVADALGDAATAVACDVADLSQVQAAVAHATETLGGVDCYFNNAGLEQATQPVIDTPVELWERLIAVNMTAIFLAAKAVAPVMNAQPAGGVLLVTSSISGRRPRPGLAAYAAAKGGAIATTEALAVDLAPKIRVNGIAPLAVSTPMLARFRLHAEGETDEEMERRLAAAVPLQRLTVPDDVAAAATFLASDESLGITGVTLNVDNGRHL